MHVERYGDASSFLERAEGWLLENEAENNLILAVARGLLAAGVGERAPYFAVLASDGAVQGCAFRTPPLKLGITRMPASGISPLVEDVARAYGSLPGVLGPEAEAGLFASAWSRRTGTRVVEGMKQGIYRLERVRPPSPYPSGHLRPARAEDRELAVRWSFDFLREVPVDHRDVEASVDEWIAKELLWLWDDGEPRSMAVEGGRTPSGSRIGWVFTPPEWRGRGYASACVAELSRQLLESGRRFCFLYTDMGNPTSNGLYQRIGYEQVSEAVDHWFTDAR